MFLARWNYWIYDSCKMRVYGLTISVSLKFGVPAISLEVSSEFLKL
jgi:hypothetical protein